MSRISISSLACLLVGTLACGSPPADPGKAAANTKAAATPNANPPAAPQPEPPKPEEPKPAEPPVAAPEADTAAPTDPAADSAADPAADSAAPDPAEGEAEAEAAPAPAAGGPTNLNGWKAPEGVDIRSDAAIPPGTPASNAAAFKGLPSAKADGPPVSAIGPSGIHFDTMVVGRGWEKSRCVEATDTFDPAVDDRVNICLRIVHPADMEETLTVEWGKTGSKATRRSTVSVPAMHAYLTRSYLPIKANYTGDWTATIKTEDGTVLASVNFTVQ